MRDEIKGLLNSLSIQKRVIAALILREIITRYGRQNIGFLWLFIEPLAMTLIITLAWHATRGDSKNGIQIAAFIATGYSIAMMWRNGSNRSAKAIEANIGMLFHRNVRVFDLFLSRLLLEVAGTTLAFVTLMIVFAMVGWVSVPDDLLYMSFAWILMAWFSMGLGLIVGSLSERFEVIERFWSIISFVLFPLSGVFYLVDSLPTKAQNFVLWFPMVHGTEMIRHGYFGSKIHTYESVGYIVLVNFLMTFIGLVLINKYSDGVEPS